MSSPRLLALVLSFAPLLAACSTRAPEGDPAAAYRAALARVEGSRLGNDPADRDAAEAALERFTAALASYSATAIRAAGPGLYASDAYLNDQLKELHGRDAIVDYLARSADLLVEPQIVVVDAVLHDGHAYVRWEMTFRTRRDADGPPTATRGVSHVIFDAGGLVSFQQDYWDTSAAIFEKVPVVGSVIRRVKAGL